MSSTTDTLQVRPVALTATLGLAAAAWVVAIRQMDGMDMGVATPLGSFAAGVVVIAAGVYELTPLKQHFREHCRETVGSGLEYGVYCVGSSLGLMLVLVAVSIMSVAWMSVIAVGVVAEKLVRPRAAIDVPLALAIVALGVLILSAPSSVPP